jgi:uncharacterized membrane-anchored protein YhcB (DUF1043 family)
MADSDLVALRADMVALRAQLTRFNDKLDSFRKHFEARFDEQAELIKSEVKNLSLLISTPKKS